MNRRLSLLRIFVLLTIGFLIACSTDDKNPFGLDKSTKNEYGTISHFLISGLSSEVSVAIPDSSFRTSDEMLIGQIKEDKSAILVKFGTIADEIDSAIITKAHLFFKPKYSIFDLSSQPMNIDAHQVSISWEEETVDPLNILANYDPTVVGTGQLPEEIGDRDSVILDINMVQNWIDHISDNNGLLILAQPSDYMKVFYSDETSFFPELRVVYEKQGVLDSSDVDATEAMSILQTTFQPPVDRLVVGSSLTYGSFFDLDADTIRKKVGEYSTINKALLTFKVDTLNSIHPQSQTFKMIRLKVENDPQQWITNPASADSSFPQIVEYRRSTELVIDLTISLQQFVNKTYDDLAFRLTAFDMGESLFRTVVYGSTVQDSSMLPKLEVFFSTPQSQNK